MEPSNLTALMPITTLIDTINHRILIPITAFFKSSITDKIACLGPKLIIFIGGCIAETRSFLFLAIIIVFQIDLFIKHPLIAKLARDILYAYGAAIITTEILVPFARIVAIAIIGSSFIAAGFFYPDIKDWFKAPSKG